MEGVGICVGCGRESGCTLIELLSNLLIYKTRTTFLTLTPLKRVLDVRNDSLKGHAN